MAYRRKYRGRKMRRKVIYPSSRSGLYYASNKNRVSRGVYRGSQRPYYIKRTTRDVATVGPIINYDSTTDLAYAFVFKLSDLPAASEFTALFDNYQIRCVVLKFRPVKNQINIGTTSAIEIPKISVAYDYDDGSLPSGADNLRQYATYREYDMTQPFTLKIYPKVSLATYAGIATTGYVRPTPKLQRMMNLDCANTGIEHYGIKMWVATTNSGVDGTWGYTYSATYYLKFSGLI